MGDISKDIQSTFVSEKIKALINIKYTSNWLNSKQIDIFKTYGLSPQQYNILRILRGAGQPIKAQQVKERMIVRAPNATRLMDKLYDKALIHRCRCEEDKRIVHVEISDEGLLLLEEMGDIDAIDLLEKLTDQEAKLLSDLLDKIR